MSSRPSLNPAAGSKGPLGVAHAAGSLDLADSGLLGSGQRRADGAPADNVANAAGPAADRGTRSRMGGKSVAPDGLTGWNRSASCLSPRAPTHHFHPSVPTLVGAGPGCELQPRAAGVRKDRDPPLLWRARVLNSRCCSGTAGGAVPHPAGRLGWAGTHCPGQVSRCCSWTSAGAPDCSPFP